MIADVCVSTYQAQHGVMHQLNNEWNKAYKKLLRVVGHVISSGNTIHMQDLVVL